MRDFEIDKVAKQLIANTSRPEGCSDNCEVSMFSGRVIARQVVENGLDYEVAQKSYAAELDRCVEALGSSVLNLSVAPQDCGIRILQQRSAQGEQT